MHSTGDIIILMFGVCIVYCELRFVDSVIQKWLSKRKRKRKRKFK